MIDVINDTVSKHNMTDILANLLTDSLGDEIKNKCKFIYPLANVYVKKVKAIKKPKFDSAKLNELYKEAPQKEAKIASGSGQDEGAVNLLHKWEKLIVTYGSCVKYMIDPSCEAIHAFVNLFLIIVKI